MKSIIVLFCITVFLGSLIQATNEYDLSELTPKEPDNPKATECFMENQAKWTDCTTKAGYDEFLHFHCNSVMKIEDMNCPCLYKFQKPLHCKDHCLKDFKICEIEVQANIQIMTLSAPEDDKEKWKQIEREEQMGLASCQQEKNNCYTNRNLPATPIPTVTFPPALPSTDPTLIP